MSKSKYIFYILKISLEIHRCLYFLFMGIKLAHYKNINFEMLSSVGIIQASVRNPPWYSCLSCYCLVFPCLFCVWAHGFVFVIVCHVLLSSYLLVSRYHAPLFNPCLSKSSHLFLVFSAPVYCAPSLSCCQFVVLTTQFLEGRSPAEFSSNPTPTHIPCTFQISLNHFISWIRCV